MNHWFEVALEYGLIEESCRRMTDITDKQSDKFRIKTVGHRINQLAGQRARQLADNAWRNFCGV